MDEKGYGLSRQLSPDAVTLVDAENKPNRWDAVLKFVSSKKNRSIHSAFDTTKDPPVKFDRNFKLWAPAEGLFCNDYVESPTTAAREPLDAATLREIYSASSDAQQTFFDSVQQFHATFEYGSGVGDIATGSHNWDDILQIVDSAKHKYNVEAIQGPLGSIRKAFRRLCGPAEAVKCFTALLPDSSLYCSIVCGGLKLLLTIAIRIGKMRGSIEKAISIVPKVLEDTKDIADIYRSEVRVHAAASELYVAIMNLLDTVLKWFTKNCARKVLKASLKQDTYGEDLEDKIKEVEAKKERFNEQAERVNKRYTAETWLHSRQSRQESTDIWKQFSEVQSHFSEVQSQLVNAHTLLGKKFDALNNECRLLFSQTRNMASQPREMPQKPPIRNRSHIEAETILRRVRNDPYSMTTPPGNILRLAHVLPEEETERAAAIMRDAFLTDWLAADESAALLINGRSEEIPESPVTLVSSTIVEGLCNSVENTAGHVIPLFFFCGEHLDDDVDAHAQGMMGTLLAQLLELHTEFDFSYVEDTCTKLFKTQCDDISILSELFVRLVSQLPWNTKLFIIIDSISFYEVRDRLEHTRRAVFALMSIIRSRDAHGGTKGPLTKLLLTSPSSCIDLYQFFGRSEILDVQYDCSPQFEMPFEDFQAKMMRVVTSDSTDSSDDD